MNYSNMKYLDYNSLIIISQSSGNNYTENNTMIGSVGIYFKINIVNW